MSEHFVKFHLHNLPFDAVIHHFTSISDEIHDHPFAFTSHILSGGYVEKVYTVEPGGNWTSEFVCRKPGTVHTVEAEHIHKIVYLPEGECWTLILPQEKTREPRFWKFDGNGSQSRAWYEGEFVCKNFELIVDGKSYAVFSTELEAKNYRLYAFPLDAFTCEIVETLKPITRDWLEFS